jgi:AraC family transcriptional regulator
VVKRRPSATERRRLATDQPASPILAPVVLGPSTLIGSSEGLGWKGLLLEKHGCTPGERSESESLDRPVLVMLCSRAWRGEHKKGGSLIAVRKTLGALTVVPKGPVPTTRSLSKSDILYCAFEESLLATVRDELEGRLPSAPDLHAGLYDHATAEILNLLFAESEAGGASGALYSDSLIHALAVRFLFLGDGRPVLSGTQRLSQRKLSQIYELIENRLDKDLTLFELATEAGYSRSHFLRMFRETTGITPHQYVLQRRIERARQLLAQTNLSIAETAYRCGFANQAHLTQAFRNECGVTPGEYRRQL